MSAAEGPLCLACRAGAHSQCIVPGCGCLCRTFTPPPTDTSAYVTWTGDNEAEVRAFAARSRFSVEVGVPLDDSSDHPHHVDRTVLVVYPHDLDGAMWHWSTAVPGDRIHADGRVETVEATA